MSVSVIVIVLALSSLVGLGLIVIALIPKRTGTTPHCPRCGYNLTGLITVERTARCPECGVRSPKKRFVYGERRVSRRLLVTGLLLAGSGGTPLIGGIAALARGVDIYQYLPTHMLAACLNWGDDKMAERSFVVLQGRLTATCLSAGEFDALIEACLNEQEREETRDVSQAIVDLLADPSVAFAMTSTQAERMYANLCRSIRLETRDRVVRGKIFPIKIACGHSIPEGYLVECVMKCRCNGGGDSGVQIGASVGNSVQLRGVNIVLFPCEFDVGPGPLYVQLQASVRNKATRNMPALYRCAMERVIPVEVLARETPSPTKASPSDKLDSAISRLVEAGKLQADEGEDIFNSDIGLNGNTLSANTNNIYNIYSDYDLINNRGSVYANGDGVMESHAGNPVGRMPPIKIDLVPPLGQSAAD